MWYTWYEWCAMLVLCLIMLNDTSAKINAKLGVTLLKQSRAWSRSKHMYYLFALSLSNGLSAELRAHFYDTIAHKCLPYLYLFFTSLLLVVVHVALTLPWSIHSYLMSTCWPAHTCSLHLGCGRVCSTLQSADKCPGPAKPHASLCICSSQWSGHKNPTFVTNVY